MLIVIGAMAAIVYVLLDQFPWLSGIRDWYLSLHVEVSPGAMLSVSAFMLFLHLVVFVLQGLYSVHWINENEVRQRIFLNARPSIRRMGQSMNYDYTSWWFLVALFGGGDIVLTEASGKETLRIRHVPFLKFIEPLIDDRMHQIKVDAS